MKVYIDNDYLCHAAQNTDGTLREFDVPALDGKCRTYIEGMRYVPAGETWTRGDGVAFSGEMLAPATDERMLAMAQGAYDDALSVSSQQATELQVAMAESYETSEATATEIQLALAEIYESIGG